MTETTWNVPRGIFSKSCTYHTLYYNLLWTLNLCAKHQIGGEAGSMQAATDLEGFQMEIVKPVPQPVQNLSTAHLCHQEEPPNLLMESGSNSKVCKRAKII